MARRQPGTPAHLGSLLGNRRIRATDRFRDARAQTVTDSNVLAFLLLEPVKKLQSAALLLDFWLGQGVRAAAIPQRCCRCFASPCGLPSAGCLPSLGCPARATPAKPKRHATLWARARKAI